MEPKTWVARVSKRGEEALSCVFCATRIMLETPWGTFSDSFSLRFVNRPKIHRRFIALVYKLTLAGP
jgi:hypothetical protein